MGNKSVTNLKTSQKSHSQKTNQEGRRNSKMTIQFNASDFFKKTNEILRQEGNNDCTIRIKDDAIIMLFDNGVQRELDADLNIII